MVSADNPAAAAAAASAAAAAAAHSIWLTGWLGRCGRHACMATTPANQDFCIVALSDAHSLVASIILTLPASPVLPLLRPILPRPRSPDNVHRGFNNHHPSTIVPGIPMFVTLPPHFLSFSAHKACLGLTAKGDPLSVSLFLVCLSMEYYLLLHILFRWLGWMLSESGWGDATGYLRSNIGDNCSWLALVESELMGQ
ncbi:hypothetical protein An02g12540 [Aspergillus niger]|uniref:Uncharacterized protein n=2 Tax=Aspergillus niger TaxID=5061 RepID=A2QEX4_ASPNC|nr:hypothetical protein An02g12540 [Aspergillus niger]CAK44524.1 hypothetical protein An02g12540 [Aspergillus niger]